MSVKIIFAKRELSRLHSHCRSTAKIRSSTLVHRGHSLLSLRLVAGGQLVEQLRVHLHERFQHIVDKGDDRLVPVLLADSVQSREHDRHDDSVVVLDQRHRVLIVPKVECPLGDLKRKDKKLSVHRKRS